MAAKQELTTKAADILVVDGDPLENIHALTKTKMVFREGVSS